MSGLMIKPLCGTAVRKARPAKDQGLRQRHGKCYRAGTTVSLRESANKMDGTFPSDITAPAELDAGLSSLQLPFEFCSPLSCPLFASIFTMESD